MFGYPCAFVHRHMFAGVHEHNMFLRLSEVKREELTRTYNAEHFAPNGRLMKEYMVIPEVLLNQPELLAQWVFVAFEYARSLPPKK